MYQINAKASIVCKLINVLLHNNPAINYMHKNQIRWYKCSISFENHSTEAKDIRKCIDNSIAST